MSNPSGKGNFREAWSLHARDYIEHINQSPFLHSLCGLYDIGEKCAVGTLETDIYCFFSPRPGEKKQRKHIKSPTQMSLNLFLVISCAEIKIITGESTNFQMRSVDTKFHGQFCQTFLLIHGFLSLA